MVSRGVKFLAVGNTGNTRALPADLRRVHMVGIGGAGMSGIARILLARDAMVSGTDSRESAGLSALRDLGALIRVGHHAAALDLLPDGPTTVITTHAAVPKTNPELVEAHRRGIRVVLRPTVLAQLMAGCVALLVTGTHGKTTTTSMLVAALRRSGLDPSFAVGGEFADGPQPPTPQTPPTSETSHTNAHCGAGRCFVAEADESDGSLLEYTPDVAVVTNIESDHLDFFGSPQAYTAVFDSFVNRLAPGGALVACLDDPGAAALAQRSAARGVRVLGYGSGDAAGLHCAARLLDWQQVGRGGAAWITLAGQPDPVRLQLRVPGRHMALNALAALLAAVHAGAPLEAALDGLAEFTGVRRRFESVGAAGRIEVFDDYAHHPTEVAATLGAVRALIAHQGGAGRCLVIFQPHLYTRTQTFAAQFGAALDTADEVFLLDVYAAREEPLPGIDGATIAGHVSVPVHHIPEFPAMVDAVAAAARPGDVIVTMGAGDVTSLGPHIVAALRARFPGAVPEPTA